MWGTGYPNTFIPFRRDVKALYNSGQESEALDKLKAVNRFQWPNYIDAFNAAEVMWSDAAYDAEEIVEAWLSWATV